MRLNAAHRKRPGRSRTGRGCGNRGVVVVALGGGGKAGVHRLRSLGGNPLVRSRCFPTVCHSLPLAAFVGAKANHVFLRCQPFCRNIFGGDFRRARRARRARRRRERASRSTRANASRQTLENKPFRKARMRVVARDAVARVVARAASKTFAAPARARRRRARREGRFGESARIFSGERRRAAVVAAASRHRRGEKKPASWRTRVGVATVARRQSASADASACAKASRSAAVLVSVVHSSSASSMPA